MLSHHVISVLQIFRLYRRVAGGNTGKITILRPF